MSLIELEIVHKGIDDATTAIDKACVALSAYESKPDPLLVKMAFDYMVTSRARLQSAETAARAVAKDPLQDFLAK